MNDLKNGTKKPKIVSLQALRAMAFLGIFLTHAYSNVFAEWSMLGVSIFFVMSGFLMMYRYEEKELVPSLKNNINFSIEKIHKIYLLHFITMLCAIVLELLVILNGEVTGKQILGLIGKIILNITLMQTWIPNASINVSLNGVAWYLSVMFFLYFIFPWLQVLIKKTSNRRLCTISVLWLFFEVVLCVPLVMVLGVDSSLYVWFMYCFPLFRLGDFFVGCVLKRVFYRSRFIYRGVFSATMYEIFVLMITAIACLWMQEENNNVIMLACKNWTTVYVVLAAMWVCVFVMNKGIITKVLSNRAIIFIGNISASLFLIHYVVIRYAKYAISYYQVDIDGMYRWILVGIELLASVLLSVGYERYIAKLGTNIGFGLKSQR